MWDFKMPRASCCFDPLCPLLPPCPGTFVLSFKRCLGENKDSLTILSSAEDTWRPLRTCLFLLMTIERPEVLVEVWIALQRSEGESKRRCCLFAS